MNSLMSVTKQFDTFEGAAQSAGKLNAILGGGVVNSMVFSMPQKKKESDYLFSQCLSGKNFESLFDLKSNNC